MTNVQSSRRPIATCEHELVKGELRGGGSAAIDSAIRPTAPAHQPSEWEHIDLLAQ